MYIFIRCSLGTTPKLRTQPMLNIVLNNISDVSDLQEEVATLREKNSTMEGDFGQKRAKFMELYKQKEGELSRIINMNIQFVNESLFSFHVSTSIELI